ncbi:MAG: glycosyltransferase family 39 protein [Gemmataceae bacterium]
MNWNVPQHQLDLASRLAALMALSRRCVPYVILMLACLACLGPFADKAFHIDDPLFLWAAQHIQKHPLDFFGFEVHWYATYQPMWDVTQNPPLTCYYIALVAALFGWSEVALHLAFVLPAVGVLWGTYVLARRFSRWPMLATLATLLTPVFLVSATNIMCDTMMLCFWVWTIVAWDAGLRQRRGIWLYTAGVLIAVTTLTKYFGISLVPLLAVYAVAVDRRGWKRWLPALLVAVLLLAGYQGLTYALYGRPLLFSAMNYAASYQSLYPLDMLSKLFRTFAFLGGCAGGLVLFLPLLWSGRRLFLLAALGGFLVYLMTSEELERYFLGVHIPDIPGQSLQFALFSVAGIYLLMLTFEDLWKERSAESLWLVLWVLGTAVFAGFVNWALNGRSVLPLVPPLAILVMRGLDRKWKDRLVDRTWLAYVPLAPAAVGALLLAWADYHMANSSRTAARRAASYCSEMGICWFRGHWGFQYYMEQMGGRPWDFRHPNGQVGDVIITADNNTNTYSVPEEKLIIVERIEEPSFPWLATMHYGAGASFYSDMWGPLPFYVGTAPPEVFLVARLKQPIQQEEGDHLGPR